MKKLEETIREVMEVAIAELNLGLPHSLKVSGDYDEQLFGESGQLSSLDTVNFLAIVEEKLNETLPSPIRLIEELMQENDSVLPTTIGELARFISNLVRN